MLWLCNTCITFILNIVLYIINIVIWYSYANISSTYIRFQNYKINMRLSHITVYQQPIFIDTIDIIYNKYKTIISSNFIQCDLLEFKYNVYTSEDHEDIDTIQTEDNEDNEENEEIKRLETILKLLKYNYKYILKKCILYIRSNIHICLYHSIIESNKKSHNVNISHITCIYKDKQVAVCKKIKITYFHTRKEIIIDIKLIKIKTLSYEINIQDFFQYIIDYFSLNKEESKYSIQICIGTIHYNFFNKHSLQIYLYQVHYQTVTNTFFISECKIKSGKKYIVKASDIYYKCSQQPIVDISSISMHIYKTTSYKLKLCLDSIISKKKQRTNSTVKSSISCKSLLELCNHTYMDTCIQTNNTNKINIKNENKIIDLDTKQKFQLNINKISINIKHSTNIYIIGKSIQYNNYNNNIYDVSIQSLCMKNMYDVVYICTKYNNSNRIYILFKNNFLNVQISPLYINIDTEICKGLINIIDHNVNDLKKLLYYDYIKYNYKEYFINHLFIHSIMVDLTYIPKNKSLYKNIFSSKSAYSIFNMINYKNIHLYTKEIDIYYPLNTSYLLKKLIKIWLKDIYKYQIKNVIKGVKYTKKIPNTIDYSAKIINNIKILLHTGIQYLE